MAKRKEEKEEELYLVVGRKDASLTDAECECFRSECNTIESNRADRRCGASYDGEQQGSEEGIIDLSKKASVSFLSLKSRVSAMSPLASWIHKETKPQEPIIYSGTAIDGATVNSDS